MSEEPVAIEEPMFDPSLKKKKKKKAVAFNEDPLGADGMDEPIAEPAPAATPIAPGPSILKVTDLPAAQAGIAADMAAKTDDIDAMFGDLKKKKKKKKEIPLDFVCV